MSPKLTTILGARPQFIKASALSRRVAEMNAGGSSISESIVHTGQHYDIAMSDVFFSELDIPHPVLRLEANGKDRPARFAEMLVGLSAFLQQDRPDVALVFGDTDTTLAGALAASQLGIPVAHVEAGLRSFNRAMPEETNRVLTDHIAQFLFCPTDTAVNNLATEGFSADRKGADGGPVEVVQCGDIQLETLRHYARQASPSPELEARLKEFPGTNGPFALTTLHRAENTSSRERLQEILDGIRGVSESLPVIIPLHPGTARKMEDYGLKLEGPGILVLPPQGFLDLIVLLRRCALVMTDSGGLQKEAYFMEKPCLTLRRETEWVELVDNGYNVIAGVESASIRAGAATILDRKYDWGSSLYGEGDTSRIVLDTLVRALG